MSSLWQKLGMVVGVAGTIAGAAADHAQSLPPKVGMVVVVLSSILSVVSGIFHPAPVKSAS